MARPRPSSVPDSALEADDIAALHNQAPSQSWRKLPGSWATKDRTEAGCSASSRVAVASLGPKGPDCAPKGRARGTRSGLLATRIRQPSNRTIPRIPSFNLFVVPSGLQIQADSVVPASSHPRARRRAARSTTHSSSPSGTSTAQPTPPAACSASHDRPGSRRPCASTDPLGRIGPGPPCRRSRSRRCRRRSGTCPRFDGSAGKFQGLRGNPVGEGYGATGGWSSSQSWTRENSPSAGRCISTSSGMYVREPHTSQVPMLGGG